MMTDIRIILDTYETLKRVGKDTALLKTNLVNYIKARRLGLHNLDYKDVLNSINMINQTEDFDSLRKLTGRNYWAIPFFSIGLYVKGLNEKKHDKNKIKNLTYSISKKGPRALHAFHLAKVGGLSGVISFLKHKSNLGEKTVREWLDRKIIDHWGKISFFVKKDYTTDAIKRKIKNFMNFNHDVFFVFSYAMEASNKTMTAIAEMNNQQSIRNNDYLFQMHSKKEDSLGVVSYCWSFEKIL